MRRFRILGIVVLAAASLAGFKSCDTAPVSPVDDQAGVDDQVGVDDQAGGAGAVWGEVVPHDVDAAAYAFESWVTDEDGEAPRIDPVHVVDCDPVTGAFRISFAAPGRYDILVAADGYQQVWFEGVLVEEEDVAVGPVALFHKYYE